MKDFLNISRQLGKVRKKGVVMIKLLIFFIISLYILLFSTEPIFKKEFINELSQRSFSSKYDTIKIKNIEIIKPVDSILERFKFNIIDDLKIHELIDYCDNEGLIFVEYHIMDLTKNFMSIYATYWIDCPELPYMPVIYKGINLFINNGNIYKIELKDTKELHKIIINHLYNIIDDIDCFSEMKDLHLNNLTFYFHNNKFYIVNPLYHKICNYDVEIFFNFDYINFLFVK